MKHIFKYNEFIIEANTRSKGIHKKARETSAKDILKVMQILYKMFDEDTELQISNKVLRLRDLLKEHKIKSATLAQTSIYKFFLNHTGFGAQRGQALFSLKTDNPPSLKLAEKIVNDMVKERKESTLRFKNKVK